MKFLPYVLVAAFLVWVGVSYKISLDAKKALGKQECKAEVLKDAKDSQDKAIEKKQKARVRTKFAQANNSIVAELAAHNWLRD